MNNDNATSAQHFVCSDNHRVEVVYRRIESEANLNLIRGIIEECSFLFPGWLRELVLDFYDATPDGETYDAVCRPEKWEYGFATIDVYAGFWDRTPRKQYETIIHELIHVAGGKMLSFDRHNLLPYVKAKNEDLGNHFEAQHTEINEEFTETLTMAIIGLMIKDEE